MLASETPVEPAVPLMVSVPLANTVTEFAPSLEITISIPLMAGGSKTPEPDAPVVILFNGAVRGSAVACVAFGVAVRLSAAVA